MKKITILLALILSTQNVYPGFRGIKWNTARPEVLRLMKKKRYGSYKMDDFWKDKLFGYNFLINLSYKKNRLYVATCSFREKKEHVLIFNILRKELLKKYGRPFYRYTDIKGNRIKKILPIDEKLFYKGYVAASMEWRINDTIIFLMIHSVKSKNKKLQRVSLLYFEKNAYIAMAKKVRNKAKKDREESTDKL